VHSFAAGVDFDEEIPKIFVANDGWLAMVIIVMF